MKLDEISKTSGQIMGKKWNPYSLFVEEEYKRMTKNGEKVIKPYLYQKLGDTWKNMPEYIKNQYKLHAKKENPFPLVINYKESLKTENRVNDSGMIEQEPLPLPPINSNPILNQSNNSIDSGEIDHPVTIKVQGIKRSHEDDCSELVEVDTRIKKHKPGIPGHLKQDDPNKLECLRYKDHHLFVSRKHCETVIDSRSDRLIEMPIYSFSVNVLCQHKEEFLPLELTIYSYSLKEGRVSEPFHVLIDPGEIPQGCNSISTDHMLKHRIEYPFKTEHPPSNVRGDYKRIYKEMLLYTKDGERTILINDEVELDQARGVIEWLYKKATLDGSSFPKPESWSIFLIVDFVAAMHNHIRLNIHKLTEPKFALHYQLRALLEKGSLDHHPELVCEYHKNPEKETRWCTRSCAIRVISNIADFLEETYQLYIKPPAITNMLAIMDE